MTDITIGYVRVLREGDRQTDGQNKQTDRQQTDRGTNIDIERDRDTDTYRERQRDADREREREMRWIVERNLSS